MFAESLLWIRYCSRHREYSSEQKKILVFTEHVFFWVWVEQTINKQVTIYYMRWHSWQRRKIKQDKGNREVCGVSLVNVLRNDGAVCFGDKSRDLSEVSREGFQWGLEG